MRLYPILLLFSFLLLLSVFSLGALEPPPNQPKICQLEIMDTTDGNMLAYVRKGVTQALKDQCKVLEVEVFSPGGSVATSIEISQTFRRARAQGLIVATKGRSFVASGATIVISSGSPGHRSISRNSLVLVHGIQVSSGPFSSSMQCMDRKQDTVDENDQLLNHVILQVATEYSINTGKSLRETLSWLRCDSSQVGNGELAVKLGLVDFVAD